MEGETLKQQTNVKQEMNNQLAIKKKRVLLYNFKWMFNMYIILSELISVGSGILCHGCTGMLFFFTCLLKEARANFHLSVALHKMTNPREGLASREWGKKVNLLFVFHLRHY